MSFCLFSGIDVYTSKYTVGKTFYRKLKRKLNRDRSFLHAVWPDTMEIIIQERMCEATRR